MPGRRLRIAWLGPGPVEEGGVGGALTDILEGLAARGHEIDCFLPERERPMPARVAGRENLTFVWGTNEWQWDRWYSRTRLGAFATGLASRAAASLRIRRALERRHAQRPYDLIYQFSTIESLAVPARLLRTVPLVIQPETHAAGELRFMIAERHLALRSQSRAAFATVVAVMSMRTLAQRVLIRRARLLICISSVFRDQLVSDYGFPAEHTVVVPNPVRVERFAVSSAAPRRPAHVLVLGRVVVRKGVEDVVAVARRLLETGVDAHIRVVGGPSLWSDYTGVLADLPAENSEFAGGVPPQDVPAELLDTDVLLQASKYEPFALTVAEALASGVPVVATSAVGAVENVDSAVAAVAEPGDTEALAREIAAMLERLAREPEQLRSLARAEAERLFAPDVVSGAIAQALEDMCGAADVAAEVAPARGAEA